MKRKILIVILISVALLGIGYAVIRPRIPEWTVAHMMGQLDELDFDAFELGLNEVQEALLRQILERSLENFSYEITGSRIEGRVAYVTLNLTVIDLRQLIINNYQLLLENIQTDLGAILGTIMSGGIERVVMQELLNLLEDESIETTLTIQKAEIVLERCGLLWNPIFTYEWLLSTLGLDDFVSELLYDFLNW